MTPQNLHVFRVIHLPWTATLPARIKIISERFQQSIKVSRHDERFDKLDRIEEMATIHLLSLGYNVVAIAEGWGCMYVISDTFEPLHNMVYNETVNEVNKP